MILNIKKIFLLIFLTNLFHFSQAQIFYPIWSEGNMPNSKGMNLEDSVSNERLMQVGTPGLRAFFTSIQENKRVAVLIIPGGGYHHLSYNISGDQLAKWFNTIGINAFVLNHRLPISPDLVQPEIAPLQDAQRAIQFIRSNAEEWNIDVDKIGVMGCSAGGHLAASLGTIEQNYASIENGNLTNSFQPNFMILISAVIDMGEYAHKGSRTNLLGDAPREALLKQFSLQNQVNENTPPAFVCHAFDDNVVPAYNSILFYEALLKNQIASTLHIFPFGKHAIALRNNPGSTNLWTALCEEWLIEMKFLN